MPRIYRTQADKRIQALNAKARRKARYLKNKYGIESSVPVANPVGMTPRQKVVAQRELQSFLQKQTTVALGSNGAHLNKTTLQQVMRLQSKVNARNKRARERYDAVRAANGKTIGEYSQQKWGSLGDKSKSTYQRMGSPGEYRNRNKKASQFPSQNSLEREREHLANILAGESLAANTARSVSNTEKMLRGGQHDELMNQVSGLTNKQRHVLLNLTPFMEHIALAYTTETKGGSGGGNQKVIDIAHAEAQMWIDAVKTQVGVPGAKKTRSANKRK